LVNLVLVNTFWNLYWYW